jgi:hypothetical protein
MISRTVTYCGQSGAQAYECIRTLAINVYDGGKLVGGSEPLHCEGIDGAQLMRNVIEWIELLKLEYGEDMSVRELRVPISGCPICGGPANE